MKKTLRVIVPILLVLVVLASIIWYLFVYDRDFTRDMLLQQARYFESRGNHATAAWLYNVAYYHADNSEDVAIELADQFKAIGNYTKAEYTLSTAIADGGSTKLYIALCKTYVEQDKLLDAVNMLENVTDPAIKAELEAMRPAAPTATPEPGFYNQYISVAFEDTDDTLYVTTNGEYPSTANSSHREPIALTTGETMIYALAVSDEGLVSPLTVLGYTVGGVVEQVIFQDAAVESAVRVQLEISQETAIFTNDLWNITEFTVPAEAQTAADLAMMPYLQKVTIVDPVFEDLTFLSSLKHLEELNLTGCVISSEEMQMIAAIPNLTHLTMAECNLSSISNLSAATKLVYLNLNSNSIRNIDVLSSITTLQEIHLNHNALTNLSALASLPSLKTLDVSYNSVNSTAPLATCISLNSLNVSSNGLLNLDGIGNLIGLTSLYAEYNNLVDVTGLANLTTLTTLDISNNTILDIAALSSLTKLEYFDFSHNEVTALPLWSQDTALIHIDGSYNLLSNLDVLGGMPQLNNVLMDYNAEITSVAALENCPMLIKVNIFGTKVTDVSMLTKASVIVNYDPT